MVDFGLTPISPVSCLWPKNMICFGVLSPAGLNTAAWRYSPITLEEQHFYKATVHYYTTLSAKAQGSLWKIGREEQGVWCKLCLQGVSEATPMQSPIWLPKHELSKDNNRHAQVDRGMPTRPQSYTKNYRQPRNADRWRNNLPQQRAHQLVIQCQWASLKTHM